MKKNAIMLADTRTWLVGHILLQLQQTNADVFDEALIYYNEISQKEKELLSRIMPCRFVCYQSPISEESKQLERFRLFSDLMFARYEMFRYLDEFETVTWIDTDVLIQKSLKPILKMARQSGMAANFEDPDNCSAQHPDKMYSCFLTLPEGYDCNRYNMSSGLICVSDTLPLRETYTQWLYDATEKYASILSLPDQGVLNMFIQRFCLHPACIGGTYCAYPYYQRDTSNEAVVHAWGGRKFWNNWYVYNQYPIWQTYYDQWIAMGGTGMAHAMQPLISVIIPCFRPDVTYFRECLDSLLKGQVDQHGFAFDNFEVIIVIEPVEYEEAQKLVGSYQDPRLIFHVNPERYGIAKSLNAGMKLARGTYIARMDDDDLAAPMRFYRQATYLNEHPETVLCTSDFEYFGDMNEYRITFEGEMSRAWSVFTCPFDHPTIMFRRDFFQKHHLLYDETRGYVEDWELWLRAFQAGMTVGCVHEGLFFHRWHNGSAGQNNRTVEMMRQLVQNNFAALDVTLRTEDLSLVAPWNGRLLQQEQLDRLQQIFQEALANNQKKKLYDPEALQQVFDLRMAEAREGKIPGIVLPPTGVLGNTAEQPQQGEVQPPASAGETASAAPAEEPKRPSLLRRILKMILKPLYAPFRNRYETPLWEARGYASGTWEHTAQLLQMMEVQRQQIEAQQRQIEEMRAFAQQQTEESRNVLQQQMEENRNVLLRQMEENRNALQEQVEKTQNAIQHQAEENKNALQRQTEWMQNIWQEQKVLANDLLQRQETSAADLHQQREDMAACLRQQAGIGDIVSQVGTHTWVTRVAAERSRRLLWTALRPQKKVFLLGTAEHSNIGDAAIAVGALEFIRQYFPDYCPVELSTYEFNDRYDELCALCSPQDLIFLQGGGNLGNRFLNEENLRRRVITDFPKNRIVILPQTIYFDEDAGDELAESERVYNQHANLMLFTRGEESRCFAAEHFPQAKSASTLDMALMLQRNYGMERNGILLCLRDLSDESGLTSEQYRQIEQTVEAFDPAYEKTNNLYATDIPREQRDRIVEETLKKFAAHKVVVTDRLHGLIFSIITGTPCVVFSAFNQKVREFVTDFTNSNAVFFLDHKVEAMQREMDAAMKVEKPVYPVLQGGLYKKMAEEIRGISYKEAAFLGNQGRQ